MFVELKPLMAEGRAVHIVVQPAADGQIVVYVEPAQKDKETQAAFCTPFRVVETPEVLDAQLGATLAQWVGVRAQCLTGLQAALAEAERIAKEASAEAAKKAAERKNAGKSAPAAKAAKPGAKVLPAPQPGLLDGLNEDGDGTDGVDAEEGDGSATAPCGETVEVARVKDAPAASDEASQSQPEPSSTPATMVAPVASAVAAPVALELF